MWFPPHATVVMHVCSPTSSIFILTPPYLFVFFVFVFLPSKLDYVDACNISENRVACIHALRCRVYFYLSFIENEKKRREAVQGCRV